MRTEVAIPLEEDTFNSYNESDLELVRYGKKELVHIKLPTPERVVAINLSHLKTAIEILEGE